MVVDTVVVVVVDVFVDADDVVVCWLNAESSNVACVHSCLGLAWWLSEEEKYVVKSFVNKYCVTLPTYITPYEVPQCYG